MRGQDVNLYLDDFDLMKKAMDVIGNFTVIAYTVERFDTEWPEAFRRMEKVSG